MREWWRARSVILSGPSLNIKQGLARTTDAGAVSDSVASALVRELLYALVMRLDVLPPILGIVALGMAGGCGSMPSTSVSGSGGASGRGGGTACAGGTQGGHGGTACAGGTQGGHGGTASAGGTQGGHGGGAAGYGGQVAGAGGSAAGTAGSAGTGAGGAAGTGGGGLPPTCESLGWSPQDASLCYLYTKDDFECATCDYPAPPVPEPECLSDALGIMLVVCVSACSQCS